ncbi:MAG: glyoxalase [Puniceicoccaceae bacterium]|nr:MAG: glyoxalase [Puniceicoccaceae bacterium]
MTPPFQLNHVAVHVADLERSRRFYREVLGFAEMERPDFGFPGAWFRIGTDQELHLIINDEVPPETRSRGIHFALQVKDAEAVRRELEEKGVEHQGPHRRPDGAFQIFLNDPDGHRIELCQL